MSAKRAEWDAMVTEDDFVLAYVGSEMRVPAGRVARDGAAERGRSGRERREISLDHGPRASPLPLSGTYEAGAVVCWNKPA
jgi:hypothetical protein